MKQSKFLLIIIFVLGFCLRFFDLSKLPVILNRDEAALAYNALLIQKSGMDEWQTKMPLVFKSFGDYKLPGYVYILSFLFKFLPTNDFNVRLPSALAGSLLIILAFFFARDILKVNKKSAILMSLLVAITPIFFFYSRIAFEANVALFLFILAIYFLFKDKNNFFLAGIFFFLAIMTYNTPLLLLPFIICLYIYKTGLKNFKKWLLPVLFLLAIMIWALSIFSNLLTQKSGITIFNDPGIWEEFAQYRNNLPIFWLPLIGNKYAFYGQILWQNLLKSFSLNFLVQNGGSHPWHSLPGYGHIFYSVYFLAIFMLIDFIGEIFLAIKDRDLNKNHLILLFMILISLTPSIVTVDSPHATRSLFFFFILISFAILFFDKLSKIFSKNKKIILFSFLSILLIESVFYYQKYFFWYQANQPSTLYVKYKDLVEESKVKYNDEKIVVIDPDGYQYILTAWYLKLTSTEFFATMKYQNPDNINFYYGERLSNYHFIKNLVDRTNQEKIVILPSSGLNKYE